MTINSISIVANRSNVKNIFMRKLCIPYEIHHRHTKRATQHWNRNEKLFVLPKEKQSYRFLDIPRMNRRKNYNQSLFCSFPYFFFFERLWKISWNVWTVFGRLYSISFWLQSNDGIFCSQRTSVQMPSAISFCKIVENQFVQWNSIFCICFDLGRIGWEMKIALTNSKNCVEIWSNPQNAVKMYNVT